jgi:hypothetical protein
MTQEYVVMGEGEQRGYVYCCSFSCALEQAEVLGFSFCEETDNPTDEASKHPRCDTCGEGPDTTDETPCEYCSNPIGVDGHIFNGQPLCLDCYERALDDALDTPWEDYQDTPARPDWNDWKE